jgi:hypothetical protein
MNHQSAIMAMLAIMSIAALVGVFTVQVADAQLPQLSVSGQGVRLITEEFALSADPENGVQIFPTERPIPPR